MDLPEIPKHRPQMESFSSSTTESAESLSTDSSTVPHLPSHRPHKHATGVIENDNPKSNISSPQIPFLRPQRSKSSDINETPVVPKRRPVIKDNENDTSDSTESIPIVPSKRPSVHISELSSTSILPSVEPSISSTELDSIHGPSTEPVESNLPTSELNTPMTSSDLNSSPIIPSSRPQRVIDTICSPSLSSKELNGFPGTEGIGLQSAKYGIKKPIKMSANDNENRAEECKDNFLVTDKGNENFTEENLPTVGKDESEFIIPDTRPSKSVSKIEEAINSVEKEAELDGKGLDDVPTEEISSQIENNIEEKKGGMVPDDRHVENVFDKKKVMSENDTKIDMGSIIDKNEAFHVESSAPTIPLSRPKKPASEPITEKEVDYANDSGHTVASASVLSNNRPKLVSDVESCPKIPFKRPTLKQNESEDSVTSGSEKKAVPKVPKKPSSKIAQFQMMLEQQQKQDLGLMNKPKHRPKPPVKRPTISEKDVNEEVKDADIPEPEEKEVVGVSPKVGKLSSRFTQNLNGMIGMALPGMGMAFGGNPVASMQATTLDNEIQDEEDIHEVKQVKDVRRARARGPRGRKLPDAVKKTVEINDETLGNKFTIFVEDSWSFSFKKPLTKQAEQDKEESEVKKESKTGEEKEEKEEKEPSTEFSIETKECLDNVGDEKDSETSEADQNDFMSATEGIVEPEPSIENVSEPEQSSNSDSTGKVVTESLDSNLGSLELSSNEESLEPSEGQSVLGSPVTGSSVLSSSEDGIVEDGDHTSSGVLSV